MDQWGTNAYDYDQGYDYGYGYEEPAYEEPVYEEPRYERPTYEEPRYERPSRPTYRDSRYEPRPVEEAVAEESEAEVEEVVAQPAGCRCGNCDSANPWKGCEVGCVGSCQSNRRAVLAARPVLTPAPVLAPTPVLAARPVFAPSMTMTPFSWLQAAPQQIRPVLSSPVYTPQDYSKSRVQIKRATLGHPLRNRQVTTYRSSPRPALATPTFVSAPRPVARPVWAEPTYSVRSPYSAPRSYGSPYGW
jgi:hypothetical protein